VDRGRVSDGKLIVNKFLETESIAGARGKNLEISTTIVPWTDQTVAIRTPVGGHEENHVGINMVEPSVNLAMVDGISPGFQHYVLQASVYSRCNRQPQQNGNQDGKRHRNNRFWKNSKIEWFQG
jgi:hypothetical protein